jgi:hypothetical protein
MSYKLKAVIIISALAAILLLGFANRVESQEKSPTVGAPSF